MKKVLVVFAIILCSGLISRANAQGLELSGGWAHATQDFGVDGSIWVLRSGLTVEWRWE